jgi:hypothetical protein
MREALLKRYNEVAQKALNLIGQVQSKDKHTHASALNELDTKFPHIKQVGKEWRIQGTAHGKSFDDKLKRVNNVNDPELIGLRDPDDPTQMNFVKRPKESA